MNCTNPERVDVAVVDDVLALVLLGRPVHLTEDVGQQSVGPVARVGVQHSVQFHHATLLRVDGVQLGGDAHLRLCRCQSVEHHRLTTAGRTDNHRRMSSHHRLIQLDDFVHLHWQQDVVLARQYLRHSTQECQSGAVVASSGAKVKLLYVVEPG